ncbi:MAG: PRC-barrel domain-containing protein [Cyanobacteria bacterium REEB65]|nr:PRC-barrel domain-containing protein [Cyanobacteria bacterium REEB65]
MSERALRNLLDLPIVAHDEVHLGDVVDAWISVAEQRLVALVIEWTEGRQQVTGPNGSLPLSQVAGFDPHQLVVRSGFDATAGLDFDPYDREGLVSAAELLDREVATRSGRVLGKLEDIYFDEFDGAVLGYEVEREAALPSMLLGPSTDYDMRGGQMRVPEAFKTIKLPPSDLEDVEAEPEEFIFEAALAERPTEDPGPFEEREPDGGAGGQL